MEYLCKYDMEQNKIIKLSTDEPIEYTYQIIEEGRPYRQFYMKEYAGVDREMVNHYGI